MIYGSLVRSVAPISLIAYVLSNREQRVNRNYPNARILINDFCSTRGHRRGAVIRLATWMTS